MQNDVSPAIDAKELMPEGAASANAPGERETLYPLTSLRFAAAAAVVFVHSRGAFGLRPEAGGHLPAVPFFFLLSGFVLAHVYSHLDGPRLRRFLVARVARVWPAHAVTLALMVPLMLLYGREPSPALALANLCLVHSWIPYPSSYFSFNAPSWSISTEFGLYLLFPLLVRNLRKTWLPKLALSLALYGLAFAIAVQLGLPDYDPTGPGADRAGVLVHPLACLHLFMIGMAASLVWKWLAPRARLGVASATVLELVAVASLVLTISYRISLASVFALLLPALVAARPPWLADLHGMLLAFPFLIVTLALRRGLVSRALSRPALVTLGEMSFSLYLIHNPVRWAFDQALSRLKQLGEWWHSIPGLAFAGLYWLCCLIAAWALWRFVERPARNWVRTWWRAHEANIAQRQWSVGVAAWASVAVLAFAGLVVHLR